MYTLSKIETVNEAVKVITLFPKESRYYWIKALNLSDSVKGYLTIYFNLI